MRAALTLILAALPTVALSAPPTCLPSEFSGLGSQYVSRTTDRGRYVAWWCPGEAEPTVYACRKGSCPTTADLTALVGRFLADPHTSNLQSMVKTLGTKASVADVWMPEVGRINAIKPK